MVNGQGYFSDILKKVKKCYRVKYSKDNLDIYWTKNWYLVYIKNSYKSIRKKINIKIQKRLEAAFHKIGTPTEQ